ncbi:MAG TPA: PD-(D/E)XK nuclease family protein, partial [Acidiphilium sp.]
PSPADRIDRLVPSRSTEDKAAGLANASPRIAADMAEAGTRRAAAMARGRLIHALLQHLPDLPESTRTEAARAYLRQPAHGLDAAAQADIETAVAGVLTHPALAPLFGPEGRAEAPVAGIVNGMEIGGLIDQLAIFPDRIVIADYKTDRAPPASPEAIPPAYLGQLAAYAAVLRAIHPGRPVTALLVWTATGAVMTVPDALLTRHAPRPQQPSSP